MGGRRCSGRTILLHRRQSRGGHNRGTDIVQGGRTHRSLDKNGVASGRAGRGVDESTGSRVGTRTREESPEGGRGGEGRQGAQAELAPKPDLLCPSRRVLLPISPSRPHLARFLFPSSRLTCIRSQSSNSSSHPPPRNSLALPAVGPSASESALSLSSFNKRTMIALCSHVLRSILHRHVPAPQPLKTA